MPRFSLKRLLLSMTLIAVGVGCFFGIFRRQGPTLLGLPLEILLMTAGGACAGTGFGLLFNRARLGFLFGALLALVGLLYIFLILVWGND